MKVSAFMGWELNFIIVQVKLEVGNILHEVREFRNEVIGKRLHRVRMVGVVPRRLRVYPLKCRISKENLRILSKDG